MCELKEPFAILGSTFIHFLAESLRSQETDEPQLVFALQFSGLSNFELNFVHKWLKGKC